MARRRCWFAETLGTEAIGPCDGRLVRCHLIRRQVLKRHGAKVDDAATWVWGCGGPTGISGHHGALDWARTIRVPRGKLPKALEAFAEAHGLGYWLDREYGER